MKTPQKEKEPQHVVGGECIVEIGKSVKRFTVAKVLASSEDTEVMETNKGAIIVCEDLRDFDKYSLFKTLGAAKRYLLKDLKWESGRALYAQLGGSVEKDVPEV